MIYLYAIADQPHTPPPLRPGIAGAAPFLVAYRDIAAVASPFRAGEAPPPTADNLWRHEAVIEDLMASLTVLPVRFGTLLASEEDALGALREHYDTFVADLRRLRGRVELGVRVLWDEDPPPDSGQARPAPRGGRAYMLARLEQERQQVAWRRRAEALIDDLHTPLARLAVNSTQRALITPRMLLAAAYLVDRDQLAAFQREVEVLSAAHPTLQFLCTGPWPAYNFVTSMSPF